MLPTLSDDILCNEMSEAHVAVVVVLLVVDSILPRLLGSGVAGPLAAEGGGQICRPFVLGF